MSISFTWSSVYQSKTYLLKVCSVVLKQLPKSFCHKVEKQTLEGLLRDILEQKYLGLRKKDGIGSFWTN